MFGLNVLGESVFFSRSGAERAHIPVRRVCADAAGGERARCHAAVSRCRALKANGPAYGEPSSKERLASKCQRFYGFMTSCLGSAICFDHPREWSPLRTRGPSRTPPGLQLSVRQTSLSFLVSVLARRSFLGFPPLVTVFPQGRLTANLLLSFQIVTSHNRNYFQVLQFQGIAITTVFYEFCCTLVAH